MDDNYNYYMFKCAEKNDLLGVIKCVEIFGANVSYIHPNSGRTALYYAIHYKNTEMIDFLLNCNVDLIYKDDLKRSYFELACNVKNIQFAKFLLEKGFDINAVNVYGETSLFRAVYFEDIYIIRFLLEHGADVTISTREGFSPLHIAALKDNRGIYLLLLKANHDIS